MKTIKNTEKLISIVIPVYNVENYISTCLDSVINQTYKNIEILLIDDGSTDRSGLICDDYKDRDKRITVIHQKNGGLSSARNAGLTITNGDFVTFIDSDDAVTIDYIANLVEAVDQTEANMATCNRFHVVFEQDIDSEIKKRYKCKAFCFDRLKAISELLSDNMITTAAWGILAPKKYWANHPFPQGRSFEDLNVTWKVLNEASSVAVLPDSLYLYISHCKSITHTASFKNIKDRYLAIKELIKDISVFDVFLKKQISFRICLEVCRFLDMYSHLSNIDKKDLNSYKKELMIILRRHTFSAILDYQAKN